MKTTHTPCRHFATLAAMLLFGGTASAQILFSDDFDLPTGGNYWINADPDSAIHFNYDYSVDGIPAAPNSIGGTTLGVKFEANMVTPTGAQAINISPMDKSFTGDYVLRFDMWINANGPFPLGGAGSTEFITAGVGTAGFSVQRSTGSTGSADGVWFAVDGEGGSGIDFRAFRGAELQAATSGVYAATAVDGVESRNANNPYYHTAFPGGQQAPASQQAAFPASADPARNQEGSLKAGTVGFAWRDVAIEKVGDEVTWSIDGLRIATVPNASLTGDNIFVGYWDVFASVSDNPAVSFGLVDNVRVEVIPEPASGALALLGGLALITRRRR